MEGPWAFARCAGLTGVTLPQNMSSIGRAAFAYCGGLAGMTFPASVSNLGDYAFSDCGAFSGAEFMGSAPAMGVGVFGAAASNFIVSFHNGVTGFTTPTWLDYPSINLDAPTYNTWLTAKFTATDIATGLTGMAADFDHDGISNLLEYAFGGNPKGLDAAGVRPAVIFTGNQLRISFKCDAACTDLVYTVQASSNLDSWHDIATSTGGAATVPFAGLSSVSDTGSGVRAVTVTDSAAASAANRRFLRIQVGAR